MTPTNFQDEEYDAEEVDTQLGNRNKLIKATGIADLADEEFKTLWPKYRWREFSPFLIGFGAALTGFFIYGIWVKNLGEYSLGVAFLFLFGMLVPGIAWYTVGLRKWKVELPLFKQQRQAKIQERAAQEVLGEKMAAEAEQERRAAHAEEERRQREAKDQQRLATLKNLVEMSEEIMLDDLANVLEMPRPDLIRKISEWGKQFGIKLKGDRVVIAKQDVAGFIAQLDEEMKDWARSESSKAGKEN